MTNAGLRVARINHRAAVRDWRHKVRRRRVKDKRGSVLGLSDMHPLLEGRNIPAELVGTSHRVHGPIPLHAN